EHATHARWTRHGHRDRPACRRALGKARIRSVTANSSTRSTRVRLPELIGYEATEIRVDKNSPVDRRHRTLRAIDPVTKAAADADLDDRSGIARVDRVRIHKLIGIRQFT